MQQYHKREVKMMDTKHSLEEANNLVTKFECLKESSSIFMNNGKINAKRLVMLTHPDSTHTSANQRYTVKFLLWVIDPNFENSAYGFESDQPFFDPEGQHDEWNEDEKQIFYDWYNKKTDA
jgi:hypothetical protein